MICLQEVKRPVKGDGVLLQNEPRRSLRQTAEVKEERPPDLQSESVRAKDGCCRPKPGDLAMSRLIEVKLSVEENRLPLKVVMDDLAEENSVRLIWFSQITRKRRANQEKKDLVKKGRGTGCVMAPSGC